MDNAHTFLEEHGYIFTGKENKKHIYDMLFQLRDRAEQRMNSYLQLEQKARNSYQEEYEGAKKDIQRIDALLS